MVTDEEWFTTRPWRAIRLRLSDEEEIEAAALDPPESPFAVWATFIYRGRTSYLTEKAPWLKPPCMIIAMLVRPTDLDIFDVVPEEVLETLILSRIIGNPDIVDRRRKNDPPRHFRPF